MDLSPPAPAPIPPPPSDAPAELGELLPHVAAVNGMAFLFAARDEVKVATVILRFWGQPCALEALYRAKPQLVSSWWAGPFRGLAHVRLFEDRVRQAWHLAAWKRWALSIRFLDRIDTPVIMVPGEGCCELVDGTQGKRTTAQELRHYPLPECTATVCRCRFACP